MEKIDKIVTTTIEILGKLYPVRCLEMEVKALQQAANYLNQKMSEVQESGKAINLERIAIITALNITHEFLQVDQQKNSFTHKINQRISQIQDKIDRMVSQSLQNEML
jgi:cell division protein ZapA